VEVRTRSGSRFGLAEESITPAKQARLIELAETYLQVKSRSAQVWRIDVIAVQVGPGLPQINHIENAVGW
jgi:putative endonuclease